jgi:hypothetical protein
MNYKYTNELVNEKSPYLLQHAHNPVNWYPWCNTAFSKAIKENKPIFLSIGYSTCHWCHVMEKESFEDLEVANILNGNFISIKVDKEERPDIDTLYMNACNFLTGSGGWPLTLFLDHHQRPFFAGTYFPKHSNLNHIGLIETLEKIKKDWLENKEKLLNTGNNLTKELKKSYTISNLENINMNIQFIAFKQFLQIFDTTFGGFGSSTKFPTPVNLLFLLRYYNKSNDDKALLMVTHTLESMYRGGIYDHIGFGFSRYSTDRKWLIPHFEKMLYDNALLALVYTETYQITKNELFAKVANDTLTYLLRDMLSKDGGFYSAEDADSEGIEGKFYIFKYNEILNVLGNEKGEKFCKQFNITKKGNFEKGNIPNLIGSTNITIDDNLIEKLYEHRNKRARPQKDDKILTSWNGLMIASLSVAGKIFHNDKYIQEAKNTVNFIFNNLIDSDGRLLSRYRNGHASILAYAEDYSYLIWGLIELYEATFDSNYLEKAIKLNEDLIKYFWDEKENGLFLYGNDSEQLLIRPKELYDGVTPSANSVSTLNWLRLSRLTSDPKLEELALIQFKTFSSYINSNPTSYTFMLCSCLFSTSKSKEIIILGDKNNQRTKEMIDIINNKFSPNITVIFKDKLDNKILKLLPNLSNYTEVEGLTTAYVCSNNSCLPPITAINELKDIL